MPDAAGPRFGVAILANSGADAMTVYRTDLRALEAALEASGLVWRGQGVIGSRPAAGVQGGVYWVPGSGLYYDDGLTWTVVSSSATVDDVAGVGSLRTLGAGAQQAAAGNHTHAYSAILGTLATASFGENASLDQVTALSADGKYAGLARSGTAGEALAFGQVCYLDPGASKWMLADANSSAGASGDPCGIVGMCVLAAALNGATKILLSGTIRADARFPTLTVNAPVYVSETAGGVVVSQPSTSGVVVRVLGHGLTGDELLFAPSPDWITHV